MQSHEYVYHGPAGCYCTLPIRSLVEEKLGKDPISQENGSSWPFTMPSLSILLKEVELQVDFKELKQFWRQIFPLVSFIREIRENESKSMGPELSSFASRKYTITDEGLVLFLMTLGPEASYFMCPLAQTSLGQKYGPISVEPDLSVIYPQPLDCSFTNSRCIRHKWPKTNNDCRRLPPPSPKPGGIQILLLAIVQLMVRKKTPSQNFP